MTHGECASVVFLLLAACSGGGGSCQGDAAVQARGDADPSSFNLGLPEKDFVIDTSQWELSTQAALPSVDCSGSAGVCSFGIEELCAAEGICFGTCGPSSTCDVSVLVSLLNSFDLESESTDLQVLSGAPLASLTINTISYKILENTLNVDLPALTVLVAPAGVTSASDPFAEAIGTLPSISAGAQTPQADADLVLTADGRDILADYMKAYSVPFNIIVGATVEISAGDAVPTGDMTLRLLVNSAAGI